MKIPLSPRLKACCDLVKPGERVADVGCDHGYLGIYLLTQGISPQVYASDLNQGPLDSAAKNAHKFGVQSGMRFFLSNGVASIPRDFDVLVCAGMGADVMISILDAAPWLKNGCYRLILQCQSRTEYLRRYLAENGWQIDSETVFRDGRFLYTVMSCKQDAPYCVTAGECYISQALLRAQEPDLPEYIHRQLLRLETYASGSGDSADPTQLAALDALRKLEATQCKP